MKRFLVALALVACSKAPPNEDKQMPKLAPPPTAAIPADLKIAVEVDGAAGPTIDAALLGKLAPDFADDERKAWKLATLVGPGATYAVTGDRGIVVELPTPADPAAPVPALLLSKRGDIVATLVDPANPFPHYHGQGGRLGRPGDPLPRVSGITKIARH